MEFIVTRTSSWNNEMSPCEGAKPKKVDFWHTRTCTEEVFNARFGKSEGLWRANGSDHTLTSEGFITKKQGTQLVWVIKIKNLNELSSFVAKHGSVILSIEDEGPNKRMGLEIYDDYRE